MKAEISNKTKNVKLGLQSNVLKAAQTPGCVVVELKICISFILCWFYGALLKEKHNLFYFSFFFVLSVLIFCATILFLVLRDLYSKLPKFVRNIYAMFFYHVAAVGFFVATLCSFSHMKRTLSSYITFFLTIALFILHWCSLFLYFQLIKTRVKLFLTRIS